MNKRLIASLIVIGLLVGTFVFVNADDPVHSVSIVNHQVPKYDSKIDIGTSALKLRHLYVDSVTVASTFGLSILTMENDATFDNATDDAFEWNENSDELIWTFGSNTVTVSSGDVTTFTFGTINVGGAAWTGTGKISTTVTTEQMRLNYDATNYATWTVAADGALTLVTVDASAAEGDINFNPDGFVGIKTADPSVALEVTGAVKLSTDLTVTGGDVTGANGNAIDIGEATDGTITFSRDDAGTVTLTSVDDDANAALTVAAGGTGALTLGDAGSTTGITSSDWTINATGDMTGIGSISADGDVNLTAITAYGIANHILDIGNYSTPLAAAMDDHFLPFCVNITNSANVAKWAFAAYLKAGTATSDQADMSYATLAIRGGPSHDVDAFYGIQNTMTMASDPAVGSYFVGDATKIVCGSTDIVGKIYGIWVIKEGAALCTTTSGTVVGKFDLGSSAKADYGIWMTALSGSTIGTGYYFSCHNGATTAYELNGAGGTITNGYAFSGTVTNAFDFQSTDGTNGAKVVQATPTDPADALIKVDIGGTAYYIPAYNAAGITGEW